MQGSTVDLVLLLLLIVFFGVQQRTRPELFFRFWFAGWIAVLVSVAAWVISPAFAETTRWRNAVCSSLMMLAGMVFLLSFIATRERLRRTVLIGLTFGAPVWLLMYADMVANPPFWLIGAMLLAVQAAGIHAVHVLLPREWVQQRRAIKTICVTFAVIMLVAVSARGNQVLPGLLVGEVFLSAAVLYGGAHLRRRFAEFIGYLGFLGWGAFYLVPVWLPEPSIRMRVFYEFWNIPKYFVGFAMVLQISESSRSDFAGLAEVYRALYEDFRLMYENHPHPMWIYETATKKLLSANVAAAESYGYTEQELLQMTMTDLEVVEEGEPEIASGMIPQPIDGPRTRHQRKDGSLVWVNVAERATLFQGKDARFVIARDVTRQLNLNRELAHRAHHDALTGLPNRVLLESRIQQCLDRCGRDERKAVLLTIDVDHFKRINDTFGHQVGDECLKTVAKRLQSKIRQVDTIARTGGEEFVAIIGGLNTAADARKVTSSLLAMFETPLRVSCGIIPLTVSIGVAVFPDDAIHIAELQFKSDQALYGAKRAGRNRAAFASAEVSSSLFEPQNRTWLTQSAEGVKG